MKLRKLIAAFAAASVAASALVVSAVPASAETIQGEIQHADWGDYWQGTWTATGLPVDGDTVTSVSVTGILPKKNEWTGFNYFDSKGNFGFSTNDNWTQAEFGFSADSWEAPYPYTEAPNQVFNESTGEFTVTLSGLNLTPWGTTLDVQCTAFQENTVISAISINDKVVYGGSGSGTEPGEGEVILTDTTLTNDNNTVSLNVDTAKLTDNTYITVETTDCSWLQLYGKTGANYDWATAQGTANGNVYTFSADAIYTALLDQTDIKEIGLQGVCTITKATIFYGEASAPAYVTEDDKYEIAETDLTEGTTIQVKIGAVGDDPIVAIKSVSGNDTLLSMSSGGALTANSTVEFELTAEQAEIINSNGAFITGSNYVYKSYSIQRSMAAPDDDGALVYSGNFNPGSWGSNLDIAAGKVTGKGDLRLYVGNLGNDPMIKLSDGSWAGFVIDGSYSDADATPSTSGDTYSFPAGTTMVTIPVSQDMGYDMFDMGFHIQGANYTLFYMYFEPDPDSPQLGEVKEKLPSSTFFYNKAESRWASNLTGLEILTYDPDAYLCVTLDARKAGTFTLVVQDPDQGYWKECPYAFTATGENIDIDIPIADIITMGGVNNPSGVIGLVLMNGAGNNILCVEYVSAKLEAKRANSGDRTPLDSDPTPVYTGSGAAPAAGSTSSEATGNEKKETGYFTKEGSSFVAYNDSIFRNNDARLIINYDEPDHDGWGDIGVVITDEDGNTSQAVLITNQGRDLDLVVNAVKTLSRMEKVPESAKPADTSKIAKCELVSWNGCTINKVTVIIDESKTKSKEEAAAEAAAEVSTVVEIADLNAQGQLTVFSKDKTAAIFDDPEGVLIVVYDSSVDGGTISFGLPTVAKNWVQYDVIGVAGGTDAEYEITVADLLKGLKGVGYLGGDDLNGPLLVQSWNGPVLKSLKYKASVSAEAAKETEKQSAAAELGAIDVTLNCPPGITINGTLTELAISLLDEADLAKVKAGEKLVINVDVKLLTTLDSKLEQAIADGYDALVAAFDLTITTKVGSDAEKTVTETNYPIEFVIDLFGASIPEGFEVAALRLHDGVITVIPVSVDLNTLKATVKSDKFSAFAIVIKALDDSSLDIEIGEDDDDEVIIADDDTTVTGGDVAGETESNPHTGVALLNLGLLVSAGAVIISSRKRRNK